MDIGGSVLKTIRANRQIKKYNAGRIRRPKNFLTQKPRRTMGIRKRVDRSEALIKNARTLNRERSFYRKTK